MKSDEIIAGYLGGKSVIDLAKEYNLSRERIYQYLRQVSGFKQISEKKRLEEIQKRTQSHLHLLPEIARRKALGKSISVIAREMGISFPMMKRIIKGTELDISKKSKAKRNKAIKKDYKRGMSQIKLSKKYNLCQSAISAILIKQFHGQLPKRRKNRG